MPRLSRMTQSSGVVGSASTLRASPLMLRLIMLASWCLSLWNGRRRGQGGSAGSEPPVRVVIRHNAARRGTPRGGRRQHRFRDAALALQAPPGLRHAPPRVRGLRLAPPAGRGAAGACLARPRRRPGRPSGRHRPGRRLERPRRAHREGRPPLEPWGSEGPARRGHVPRLPPPVEGHDAEDPLHLADGEVVKIKFGGENGEVFGEVAASRLLSALGFGADPDVRRPSGPLPGLHAA